MAMAWPSSRQPACRSSGWAMPPPWAVCLAGNRQSTWPWRATMRPASSFNGLRAERRAGAAIARTAPVDGPKRSKDKKRMTEQKETTKPTKPLTLSTAARPGAAAAKGGETQVRQKFSHGRTRAVTVEVKKPVKRPTAPATAAAPPPAAPAAEAAAPAATARTLKLGGGAAAPAATTARAATPAAPARSTVAPRPTAQPGGRGIVLRTLTEEEKEARARALVDANRDAGVARERAAEDAKRRAVEDKARAAADEEHRKRLAD